MLEGMADRDRRARGGGARVSHIKVTLHKKRRHSTVSPEQVAPHTADMLCGPTKAHVLVTL